MARKEKLKETKVLLTDQENVDLDAISSAAGQSKTSFCTTEIRKIIKKRKVN